MRECIIIGSRSYRVEVCIDDQDYIVPASVRMQGSERFWMSRSDVKELRKALNESLHITSDLDPGI